MEFTAWEESQHRHNATDFVDPWDSTKPFEPDSFVTYDDELDPHDAAPSHHPPLGDEYGDFHHNTGDRGFFLDDPSMHVPPGMSRPEFVGPGELHSSVREPTAFDEGENTGRGHKRELSEAFTMRYPLVSPSHNPSFGHGPSAITTGGDTSPDLTSNMMRTPVRDFSAYPFDAGRTHDSPSYGAGAGLESPLESLALQSPYMACQPFPALPRVQEHQGPLDEGQGYPSKSPQNIERLQKQQQHHHHQQHLQHQHQQQQQQQSQENDSPRQGTGVPSSISKSEHKADKFSPTRGSQSSSGSLSSSLSAVSLPQAEEQATAPNAVEVTPDRGPQTPRASSSKSRSKSRRTPSSVTPRAGDTGQASTSTPTPTQDGRRDSRKRIAKDQIEILEAFFHKNPRPEREDRMRLSSETNLEPRTVQIWFQNRRAKSRSMKMPPSQADNSVFAQQYRAAAAAASNAAAAAAGSQPMMGMGPQGPVVMDRTPSHGEGWTLTPHQQRMLISPAGSRHTPGYGVFQPQQRVYTGHGSPPPHGQSMGRYHQQLGGGKQMHPSGPQAMQGAPPGMPFQNMPQMHPMHQAQAMVPNTGPGGPQLMPAMGPARGGHGRSMSAFEPFVNGYGAGPPESDTDSNFDASMMYASKAGSSASLTSIGSSYGLPQSPLNTELMMEGAPPVYSPSMQSLQNSPDMNSPNTTFPTFPSGGRAQSMSEEPVQLSRSQSAHSFGDAWARAAPMGEMKRRRSLYGAVPTWGWADHNSGPYVHASPPRTPSLSSNSSSAGSTGGTLAASAAAAALRTRNRSSTQPPPRSRQPSIRLQLDESNHSATLVVLPQEGESPRSGGPESRSERTNRMSPRNSNERLTASREMSPERAERAAERLLAERAAAATMGARPSTRQGER